MYVQSWDSSRLEPALGLEPTIVVFSVGSGIIILHFIFLIQSFLLDANYFLILIQVDPVVELNLNKTLSFVQFR